MELTKRTMAGLVLPAGKNEYVYWDDTLPGFGVRLRQSKGGVNRTYRIQFRVGSQQRSKSLDARKVSLEDARKHARQLFAKAQLGHDPAAEKATARAAALAAKLTLGAVSDRYLASKEQAVKAGIYAATTYDATERYFKVHWAPLRDRPLDSIKRADVAARLQEVTAEHGRAAATKARATLAAMYRWSQGEGLTDSNPVFATNNPGLGGLPRERVLSDAEIKALWSALGDDDFGLIVRLLLLLGTRRDEIGKLKWSEVDLENGLLQIPGARVKNRRMLTLKLPRPALAILRAIPRRDGHVFGNPHSGFSSWSAAKRQLDARLAAAGTPLVDFRLHDCRRTMRTGLSRLGIRSDVAEMAIGHAKTGIIAIYDKHRFENEVANALAAWASCLLDIVEGKSRKGRVVPLRTA
jgi:integrase